MLVGTTLNMQENIIKLMLQRKETDLRTQTQDLQVPRVPYEFNTESKAQGCPQCIVLSEVVLMIQGKLGTIALNRPRTEVVAFYFTSLTVPYSILPSLHSGFAIKHICLLLHLHHIVISTSGTWIQKGVGQNLTRLKISLHFCSFISF